MEIRERYPLWMRLYAGRFLSKVSLPVRHVASKLYGSYVTAAARRANERIPERIDSGQTRIVSVGNLEAGGGGKTPCVIALAEALLGRGEKPAVVTRGYRGDAERSGPFVLAGSRRLDDRGVSYLESEGLGARIVGAPEQFGLGSLSRAVGDEAVLYAARDIPAVVTRDRKRGIEIAGTLFHPTHILLDDAFQNRSVARDLDILLLDWERPFGDGRLIPLGSLREPREAARRADCIILTRADERVPPSGIDGLSDGKPVFYARHRPRDLIDAAGRTRPLEDLSGARVALFSGIARPRAFEESVGSIGAMPMISFRFPDHHRYGEGDVRWMARDIEEGWTIVTTEKDLVKAGRLFSPRADLVALRIDFDLPGIDSLLDLIGGPASGPAPGDRQSGPPSGRITSS